LFLGGEAVACNDGSELSIDGRVCGVGARLSFKGVVALRSRDSEDRRPPRGVGFRDVGGGLDVLGLGKRERLPGAGELGMSGDGRAGSYFRRRASRKTCEAER
jgi:hypothetical protein